MYIKFKNEFGRPEVRDVRHFDIRSVDCGEEDGSTTHGAELVDMGFELAADFVDAAVEYACGLLLGGRSDVDRVRCRKENAPVSVVKTYSHFCPDMAALAWFRSWEAAEEVREHICEALDAGKQFFDLTRYGEDGKEAW